MIKENKFNYSVLNKSSKLIVIALFFVVTNLFAQSLKQEKTLDFNAELFTIDKLGFLYALSDGNVLKADSNGVVIKTFSSKGIGNINFIDVSNPLRILVYVKDFSVVYFLDNQLAVQSSINLREKFFTDPWPLCNSNNDGFWIYNPNNNLLQKYDYTLKEVAQSQPLSLLVADEIKPTMLIENDKWLVLHNEGVGFMLFNRLGSYDKTLRDSTATCFVLTESMLSYISGNYMVWINLETGFEIQRIPLNIESVHGMQWFNNKLYILNGKTINVYTITG